MLEKRTLVCIVCPVGCKMEVHTDCNKVEAVSGCKCKRGKDYAITECINPVRTLTSTVTVLEGQFHMAPVKSDKPIPKQLIFECMKEINLHILRAPVKVGDIVVDNVLNTGINIVATSNVPEKIIQVN